MELRGIQVYFLDEYDFPSDGRVDWVTLVGTMFSMFVTSLMAYGLSRRDLDGRKVIMFLVVFTMLFSGGLIPTFLVVRSWA